MKKKSIVFFLLSGLLIACASATPTTLPTAMISSAASTNPTRTSSHTFTPLPIPTMTQTRVPAPEATLTPLPGSDLILERVAQVGGSINGITVVGDVAYVGMGPRLAEIDISQHASPRLVSQSEPLPGLVTHVLQISGEPNSLLLVNAGKYLVVVDPAGLKPIQQLELAGAISAMVWDNRANILYAGGSIYQAPEKYAGFITAVDLTPDNRLKLIDSVTMPERPLSLALGKGSLFAGAEGYEGGLYHIQVKTPGELSTPHLVIASTPPEPFQPTIMQVIGERLYVGYRAIEAYDITNPDHPVRTWRNFASIVVKGFNVAGNQIIAFGWTIKNEYMLDTIPVAEPIEGSPLGVIASVTAMHNGDFLVAYNDLEIYDAANPQVPQLMGSYQAPVIHAIDAAANEKAVFVVDSGIGDGRSNAVLRVLSLPDLKPIGEAAIDFPNSWYEFNGIVLEGDRVYLLKVDGVWVYDVSSSQPVLLGKARIEDEQFEAIAAIKLGEKRLLVTSQEMEGDLTVMTVYDLTDLRKPAKVGNPLTLDQGRTLQITWKASALVVLLDTSYHSDSDRLYVVDFDNNLLTLRKSLPLPEYVNSMAVDDGLIGLTSTEGLSIVSLVKPEPLKLLVQTTTPEFGLGAAIIQDKALVVAGDAYGAAQLLMFDIQDPANPRQIEAMDIAVSELPRVPILLTKPYVVLANGSGGVEVLGYRQR